MMRMQARAPERLRLVPSAHADAPRDAPGGPGATRPRLVVEEETVQSPWAARHRDGLAQGQQRRPSPGQPGCPSRDAAEQRGQPVELRRDLFHVARPKQMEGVDARLLATEPRRKCAVALAQVGQERPVPGRPRERGLPARGRNERRRLTPNTVPGPFGFSSPKNSETLTLARQPPTVQSASMVTYDRCQPGRAEISEASAQSARRPAYVGAGRRAPSFRVFMTPGA